MTDLSDTVLLRLRQDATFRLPLAEASGHVEVTFGEGSDRQVLRFEDPAMVEWLLDLRTPMALSSVLEHARTRLSLDTPAAQALVSRLAAVDLIATDATHTESSEARTWESRGWRDALDFQLASRGLRWEHHDSKPSVMTVHLDTKVASDPLPEVLQASIRQVDTHVLPLESGASTLLTADFFDTLFRRRTFREFRAAEIGLDHLSAILNGTFGVVAEPDRNDALPFVTYAASFPFGIYVAAFRVRGLAPAIYEYVPARRGLRLRHAGSVEKQVSALAFGMKGVEEAAAAMLYTVRWASYMQKYRFARAYRLALFELAGAVQSQLLATTAVGLRTFLTPAIDDRQAAALLSIPDPLIETPMYLTTLG